jgi:predicted aspartyl protease
MVRCCFIVIAVLLLPLLGCGQGQQRPAAQPSVELATVMQSRGYTEIPLLLLKDGRYGIEVQANGHPLRFLLDTGAASTFIDTAVAERLQLPLTKTDEKIVSVTGTKPLMKTTVERLLVGTAKCRGELIVNDFSHMGAEHDGVLGNNILKMLGAVIDYSSAKLFLFDPTDHPSN